jgi:Domain of unknown function (DUF4279)
MRIQAYLRAVSDERTIRALHEGTNIPGTSIQQLKARKDPATDEMWWNWKTDYVDINQQEVDHGVREMLQRYSPFFPAIKKFRGDADLYLELVVLLKQGETAPGLYLSAESIALLNDLGAGLDNDVVLDIT